MGGGIEEGSWATHEELESLRIGLGEHAHSFPTPWANPKHGSTLGFYNLHHRCISRIGEFYFLDLRWSGALGCESRILAFSCMFRLQWPFLAGRKHFNTRTFGEILTLELSCLHPFLGKKLCMSWEGFDVSYVCGPAHLQRDCKACHSMAVPLLMHQLTHCFGARGERQRCIHLDLHIPVISGIKAIILVPGRRRHGWCFSVYTRSTATPSALYFRFIHSLDHGPLVWPLI